MAIIIVHVAYNMVTVSDCKTSMITALFGLDHESFQTALPISDCSEQLLELFTVLV